MKRKAPIPHVRAKQRLSARSWNQIVDSLPIEFNPSRPVQPHFIVNNNLGEAVPAYSIFGIGAFIPGDNPYPKITAKKGNYVAILTNGGEAIPNGSQGAGHAVSRWNPVLAVAGESLDVGDTCGPTDTEFRVKKTGQGLVAMSPAATNGAVWVLPADAGGGASAVATITTTLPARVLTTPGGPVAATIQESMGGSSFTAGDTVLVYSWLGMPTVMPSLLPGNILYIYIAQDLEGTWWLVSTIGVAMGQHVATVEAVIPGRTIVPDADPDTLPEITAGGPINATLWSTDPVTGIMTPTEAVVPLYSWVQTDSDDPTEAGIGVDIGTYNDPQKVLFVFVEQDGLGTWWYTAQDCAPPSQ